MPSVLQPRSSGGNVIRRTLPLDLDQDDHIRQILPVPLVEWFQELQTVRLRIHIDPHRAAVRFRRLVRVLTRVETLGRELIRERVGQFELLPIASCTEKARTSPCASDGQSFPTGELVGEGIEIQAAGNAEGRHQFRRGDEAVRGRVGVVASREVSVVRGDDGVLLPLFHVLAVPLADARSASVGQDLDTR